MYIHIYIQSSAICAHLKQLGFPRLPTYIRRNGFLFLYKFLILISIQVSIQTENYRTDNFLLIVNQTNIPFGYEPIRYEPNRKFASVDRVF